MNARNRAGAPIPPSSAERPLPPAEAKVSVGTTPIPVQWDDGRRPPAAQEPGVRGFPTSRLKDFGPTSAAPMPHTSPVRTVPSDRRLAAVLFLDIVGSTTIASEVGDRRWRELLTRFRRTVRTELRRGGGREEDTAGDGFFATFTEPARAVRTAEAIARAVHEHGLEIRCGLHFGECEVADGKLAGIAVHIGARVMSLAGPAEILVTSTIRDLATGSGIGFEDRSTHELKGVPGTWHLFVVRTIDERRVAEPLPTIESAERVAAVQTRGVLARRGPALISSGALVGLSALIAVVTVVSIVAANRGGEEPTGPTPSVSDGPGASPTPSPSSPAPTALHEGLTRLDPDTGEFTGSVDGVLEGGLGPSRAIAFAERAVWVIGEGTVLIRVDADDLTFAGVRGAGGGDVAAGDEQVWIATSTGRAPEYHSAVSRIDPVDSRATRAIELPGTYQNALSELAVGDGYVWCAYPGGLARVDTDDGEIHVIDTSPWSADVVEAYGSVVWATDVLNNVLYRVDVRSSEVARVQELDQTSPDALGIGPAGTWFVDTSGGFAQEVQESGLGEPIQVGLDPIAIAVGEEAIWVANRGDDTVSRIDALTHVVMNYPVPGSPISLALEPQTGAVWVYLI